MKPDLLPCPFCGSVDCKPHVDDVAYLPPAIHYVLCRGCGASGANVETIEQAAAAWNRRVALPSTSSVESMEKEIIRLRNELEFERAAHTKAVDHLLLELDEARALIYEGYEDISRMKMLLSKKDEAFLSLLAAAEKRGRENERLRRLEIADPEQKWEANNAEDQ